MGIRQKQSDFDYSCDELRTRGEQRILKRADEAQAGAIFFNNHVHAQAPRNALLMTDQLVGQGFSMEP